MKILIATGIFRPEVGGPATIAAELGKRLKTLGHEVTILTYSDDVRYDSDKDQGVPIVRVVRSSNKLIDYASYFFAVRKHARGVDIIYSLDWFSAGFPVMLAARTLHKKYVIRIGGGYTWEKYLAQGKPPVTLKQFYDKALYRHYWLMEFIIANVIRNASAIIFNSDDQRILYQKFYRLDSARVVTIFNPTPEYRASGILQSFRVGDRSAPEREFVFAGRFIKMKNLESLIRAFASLADTSFSLLLIGEGPDGPALNKLAADLGLSSRVTFLPVMPPAELYRRIANCYAFVIPSWTDISPNQAFECFSLGIPLLITKENYLPAKAQPSVMVDPASVADIAENMNRLLDPSRYAEFVKDQSTISYRHTWQEFIDEHRAVFQKVIKNSL